MCGKSKCVGEAPGAEHAPRGECCGPTSAPSAIAWATHVRYVQLCAGEEFVTLFPAPTAKQPASEPTSQRAYQPASLPATGPSSQPTIQQASERASEQIELAGLRSLGRKRVRSRDASKEPKRRGERSGLKREEQSQRQRSELETSGPATSVWSLLVAT